jgi:hypothetical protein
MSTAITNHLLKVIPSELQVLENEKGKHTIINSLKHLLMS